MIKLHKGTVMQMCFYRKQRKIVIFKYMIFSNVNRKKTFISEKNKKSPLCESFFYVLLLIRAIFVGFNGMLFK